MKNEEIENSNSESSNDEEEEDKNKKHYVIRSSKKFRQHINSDSLHKFMSPQEIRDGLKSMKNFKLKQVSSTSSLEKKYSNIILLRPDAKVG
jgi:hypothetical protein